jgi:hypothetical protein
VGNTRSSHNRPGRRDRARSHCRDRGRSGETEFEFRVRRDSSRRFRLSGGCRPSLPRQAFWGSLTNASRRCLSTPGTTRQLSCQPTVRFGRSARRQPRGAPEGSAHARRRCHERPRRGRVGFTLIRLLVIAIIGILIAPCCRRQERGGEAGDWCQHNLKQIGPAPHSFRGRVSFAQLHLDLSQGRGHRPTNHNH